MTYISQVIGLPDLTLELNNYRDVNPRS